MVVAWYDPGTDSVAAATSSDGRSFSPIDLGMTMGGWSPAAATTSDGATRFIAWYDSTGQNAMLSAYGELGTIALAQPSPTPTEFVAPSSAPSASQCAQVVDGKVTVVAQGIAYTDGKCIDAPAGQDFTIVFDNRDAGVQHNIQIFSGPQVSGSPIFSGDLVTGPDQAEYQVKALDAGTYAFNCVVHPTTMIGQINVTSGGGGGGGAGGGGQTGGGAAVTTTVTAQGIAFDTSTITLAAGKPTTITFDNNDAGVQHNIAIYPSAQDLSKPLFRGDLVTGPGSADYQIPALDPGTYYFRCDVHPTMNGQVVVQ
jgi:plastocyanin